MTEVIYVGHGASFSSSANEWGCVLGNDSNSTFWGYSSGYHYNGLDFARTGSNTPPGHYASFSGCVIHTPSAVQLINSRNNADNNDILVIGTNSSDQVLLANNTVMIEATGGSAGLIHSDGLAITGTDHLIYNPGGSSLNIKVGTGGTDWFYSFDNNGTFRPGSVKVSDATYLASCITTSAYTNGASASTCTLGTQGPNTATVPTKWIPILDGTVTRYIPAW